MSENQELRPAAPAAAAQEPRAEEAGGRRLRIPRYFTTPGRHPADLLEWERRTATIANDKAETIFEQADVEFPRAWSQMATNVVSSKYFYGALGSPRRESSLRGLIGRVTTTLRRWGLELGYFDSDEDAEAFEMELSHILLHQMAAFNSPVWFNMGIEERPQCSACFINSVADTMESILDLAKTEGMLFKFGSGTGTNFSSLRSSRERLSTGGTASGPVSFMRGYDAFAGVIKSGGKTRRAAKMVILNVDHPDIVDFIQSKVLEEKKAWALIGSGFDGSLNGEAYGSVFFQNSNHSVRVADEFMKAVENDGEWQTRAVTSSEPVDTYRARDLMKMIGEATWLCGDPGLQFHTTVNTWHTCPASGPIRASNPCSEFMFLDNSACNLCSLNLMKFVDDKGAFDPDAFRAAVAVLITAQEIIVDCASYPTEEIAGASYDYRPLGLGYANLGTLLMSQGLPYDSDEGRALAAAVTAIMTGQAYAASAEIARVTGPFKGFARNREAMMGVMRRHRDELSRINPDHLPRSLLRTARRVWDEAIEQGERWGYRNAQTTVLAPTGTIAFMMDCDTTGIEPDLALVKYKKLVGGGILKMVNQAVPHTLARLGYAPAEAKKIIEHMEREETIEGAPGLKPQHLAIFDCAFRPRNGKRFIHHDGHVRMMAATQPFISGAISKTVNVPAETTPEQIAEIYLQAWKAGLKAIAIYRDGSKRAQPLSLGGGDADQAGRVPVRRRLPEERQSITHKFVIGDHEGYLTVGLYPEGTPGEIFIVMAKEGTVVSGLCDCFATTISIALQYGVPLKVLADKFIHTRFEPSGFTHHPEIRYAKSITDYIFRWLSLKFIPEEGENPGSPAPAPAAPRAVAAAASGPARTFVAGADAPICPECGSFMERSGSCHRCTECGSNNGCS
ncbi:MAG: vitamin B12-dependent ribonucleotide reductase [Candidatus Eisenbacteria bacterium]|uniref:Vitamin B12-dependent ribonucleotide reductase n=1 Tax=Eiseniibacteriota bacterium TaxID=2212470 RepID=A0A937X6P5_UNCEI|nr:vitamin B12-dependent ribonucleotide reductase [Candidatus Eisenbacteria bacterium]